VNPRDCLGAVEKSFLHQPGIEIMSLGWPTCKLVTNTTAPPQTLTRHSRIHLHVYVCVCVCVCVQDISNNSTSMGERVRQENGSEYSLIRRSKIKHRMIFAAKHRPHLLIQEIVQGMLTAVIGGVAVWNCVSPSG